MTKTDISNLALTKIGAAQINDYDEASQSGVVVRQFFDSNYESVLRSHFWRCATKRATLARLSDTPAFGWAYQYQLPSDYLQIISLEDPYAQYTIEQDKLLTDEGTVKVKYIFKPSNYSLLDPLCLDAIYVSLAAKISYPLTQDANLRASLIQEVEDIIIPAARYHSAIEQNESEVEEVSSWVASRRSYPGWWSEH